MAFKQLREDSRVVSVMSVSMYTSFYHIKKEETQHHIHNLVFNVCVCGSGFVYTLQMKCPHKDIKKLTLHCGDQANGSHEENILINYKHTKIVLMKKKGFCDS